VQSQIFVDSKPEMTDGKCKDDPKNKVYGYGNDYDLRNVRGADSCIARVCALAVCYPYDPNGGPNIEDKYRSLITVVGQLEYAKGSRRLLMVIGIIYHVWSGNVLH
jgi:hypothetical protein